MLSQTQREAAARRHVWQEQIDKLREHATKLSAHDEFFAGHLDLFPQLQRLPRMSELSVLESRISPDTAVTNGFQYYEVDRRWLLDDGLLSSFARRFENDVDAGRAARLFLLHETVHHDAQGLTGATAQSVGRFARVLETLDYHADTYAILHEYDFATRRNSLDATIAQRFTTILDSALGTFWAFDENEPTDRMQVRRVHRYLIWYWQLLRLGCTRAQEEAFSVLADRPFIELAGPRQQANRERTYFMFDKTPDGPFEIGLVWQGRLRRFPNGPAANLTDMITGFRRRDGALVKQTIKGIFDQVQ
jgi:hypothetical protein